MSRNSARKYTAGTSVAFAQMKGEYGFRTEGRDFGFVRKLAVASRSSSVFKLDILSKV